MYIHKCNKCDIVFYSELSSDHCPMCNNIELKSQLIDKYSYDYIIPFSVTKTDAIDKFNNVFKGKKLIPNSIKNINVEESIKKIYIPCYLYDVSIEGEARYIIDGNDTSRIAHIDYKMVPSIATRLVDEARIDGFDMSKLIPFNPSYLEGSYVIYSDVTSSEGIIKISDDTILSAVDLIGNVNSGEYKEINNDLVIKPNNTYLALLPIYMIKTTYKDKNYTYVINGDNCKLLGTLPISYFKIVAWFISHFDLFFIIGLIILLVIKGVMI